MSQRSSFSPKRTDDPYERNFCKHLVFTAYNTELSRWIWAHQYVISMDPAPSLKNYSHLERRLIDMPHIFSESLDNSEQNLHRCILIFFFNFFLGRALTVGLLYSWFSSYLTVYNIKYIRIAKFILLMQGKPWVKSWHFETLRNVE